MNDQNDKLNNQELNKSAQNVHSFGVQNDDLQAKEEIGNRINESKKKNLDSNTKRTSKDNAGEITSSSDSSLPRNDGLDDGKSTSLKDKLNPKNLLQSAGRSALRKKSEDDSLSGDAAKVANKALDTKAKIDSVKAIITFLKTPAGKIIALIGAALIALIVIIALAAVLSNPFQLIISSIGMKFGLTGQDTYSSATRDNEEYEYMYENIEREYEETFDRSDVECMVDGSTGKVNENCKKQTQKKDLICANQSLFRKIWLWIFKTYNPTDACEFMQLVRYELKKVEDTTSIQNIAPGYMVTTFYYAFETQNYNEEGEPFIAYNTDDTVNDEVAIEPSSDIDAINLLFAHKRNNGKKLFEEDDVRGLLWQYVYQEHYKYWVYKYDEVKHIWFCEENTYGPTYKTDVDKYELFLRYGSYGSVGYKFLDNEGYFSRTKYDIIDLLPKMEKSGNRGYEGDKNIIAAYERTSEECYEELENLYGTKPPGLSVYNIRANPDTTTDDRAVLNLSSGSYDYSKGFIFKRYPRYIEEFTISNKVIFNFWVAKEIEEFIKNIAERQDYTNYLLGYESDIGNLVGTKGQGTTGTTEIVCDYSELENGNLSSTDGNILIELMYPSSIKFDAFNYTANSSMGITVDLEKYVLGAVYAEAGGEEYINSEYVTNLEATVKAKAVMVRSFVLSSGNAVDGKVQIANSTTRQTYCDPDEGCYRCKDSTIQGNVIIVPISDTSAQNNSQCTLVGPLSSSSPLRGYVNEVAGQVLTDTNGNIVLTQYDTTKLKEWYKDSNTDSSLADMDYIELLAYQYGTNNNLTTVECEVVTTEGSSSIYPTTGTWDSWRQCGESWSSQPFGESATLCSAGCLITSYAKLLAASGKNLLISPFNPGNYAIALNDGNCFEGNNLKNYCALDVAVGAGNYTYSSGSLTGTQEEKRAFVTNAINQGYQVIISVKNDGHWVYVTGTTSTDIVMSDPAGRGTNVFESYGNTATSYKLIKIY